jgi:YD repeat-containing protein
VGAASQTWRYAYDKTDNAVSLTDPRSNVFGWAFDSLNRLIRETDEGASPAIFPHRGRLARQLAPPLLPSR